MGRPNLSGFVYVEQDPPLKGLERKRDYTRQYGKFLYRTSPPRRETAIAKARLQTKRRVATGENAEYLRRREAEKRARMLAVAREYGAEL